MDFNLEKKIYLSIYRSEQANDIGCGNETCLFCASMSVTQILWHTGPIYCCSLSSAQVISVNAHTMIPIWPRWCMYVDNAGILAAQILLSLHWRCERFTCDSCAHGRFTSLFSHKYSACRVENHPFLLSPTKGKICFWYINPYKWPSLTSESFSEEQ
jgi:hypothetical protein